MSRAPKPKCLRHALNKEGKTLSLLNREPLMQSIRAGRGLVGWKWLLPRAWAERLLCARLSLSLQTQHGAQVLPRTALAQFIVTAWEGKGV